MSDDPNEKTADYDVGYGKPPKATQFKKGKSGNPKGKPKGHKNFKTDLKEALDTKISVRIDGREKKMTKQRAFIESLVGQSLQGNDRARGHLLSTIVRFLDDNLDNGALHDTTAEDLEILQRFEQRLAEKIKTRGGKK